MTAPVASPHTMNTYGRLPVALSHGKGLRVWDTNGKCYLDGLAGIAVNTLGHAHPKLTPALQDQIGKMIHSCNYYHIPNQEALAEKLVELSGLTNVFFCSTGLEANEAALKLARKFGHSKGIENPEIVVYEKSFHGRSLATLAATGNDKIKEGFGPMMEGFVRVPVNDIDALKQATAGNPNLVAVFMETIQGEGGIQPMRIEYLKAVRQLCDEKDWLMMIDEVQCGMGRTGKWFAHQWAGIVPDVVTMAKAMGNGMPIGALWEGNEEQRGRAGILTLLVTVTLANIFSVYLRLPLLSLPFVVVSSLAYIASLRYGNLMPATIREPPGNTSVNLVSASGSISSPMTASYTSINLRNSSRDWR